MKNILTGNEAIEAYTEISTSSMVSEMPKVCGYFNAEDAEDIVGHYDKDTVFAFDNTESENYYEVFGSEEEAWGWCES